MTDSHFHSEDQSSLSEQDLVALELMLRFAALTEEQQRRTIELVGRIKASELN